MLRFLFPKIGICLSLIFSFQVQATPVEHPQLLLHRTAADGLVLNTELSKNIFVLRTRMVSYTEQVAYQELVTYTESEIYYTNEKVCRVVKKKSLCSVERVGHGHLVSKTKYVTSYRQETKCCRPITEKIFDHQELLDVHIVFPQGTALQNQETESLVLYLTGNEAQPDVSLSFLDTVFKYQILHKEMSEGILLIELAEPSTAF